MPTALICSSSLALGHLAYVPEGQTMKSKDSHHTRLSGLLNLWQARSLGFVFTLHLVILWPALTNSTWVSAHDQPPPPLNTHYKIDLVSNPAYILLHYLSPRAVVPVRVPSIGQIDLFEMMKWIPVQNNFEDTFLYLILLKNTIVKLTLVEHMPARVDMP